MKNIMNKILSATLSIIMILPVVACSNENEDWMMKSTESNNQTSANKDVTTITFAVPDIFKVDYNHLQQFNDELISDGYKYQLVIKYIEDNEYSQTLENELENGNVDVAFLGLGNGSNNLISLINSGLIYNLDEILTSEKGKAVYEAFPKPLWESVKCNGHIYSIPNTNADDQGIYAAFNKDYIEYEAIESWDGSIESIFEIIKNVEWDDESAPRFQYLLNDFRFEEMIGCEIRNGLLYDYDTMQIVNPLESEKFIGFLNVLEQMKSSGFMAKSVSYNANVSYIEAAKNIENGKFLVLLSSGEPEEMLFRDNICIKKIRPCLSSRVNGSIGIASNTKNINAVISFMGVLYGKEKYGNILLYGKQDVDYKLIDGFAVNTDGTDLYDNYLAKLCLNLFINIHPVKGERYSNNRREEYFSFYDDVIISPFIGFEADNIEECVISNDLKGFMNSLNNKSLDEAVRDYSEILEADGIDEYLSSVRKQWDTYKQ